MVEAMTLVERLRDAWRAHYGSSLNHGCVDCGLSANLCDEAADRITALEAEIARKDEALRNIRALASKCYAVNPDGYMLHIEGFAQAALETPHEPA